MASIKGFTIKGLKTWEGRSMTGAQGFIYHDGNKVGWYDDQGKGGAVDIDFCFAGDKKQEYEKLFEKTVLEYYTERCPFPEEPDIPGDECIFMCELTDLIMTEKQYKKLLRDGFPFAVFYKDKKGEYRVFGTKNESELEAFLASGECFEPQTFKSLSDFDIR